MALTDEDKSWIAAQLNTLDAKVENVKTALDAKIEKVETALLTEFHKWASPRDTRLRSHSIALRALDLDLEELKDRVRKLEDQRSH